VKSTIQNFDVGTGNFWQRTEQGDHPAWPQATGTLASRKLTAIFSILVIEKALPE